MSGPTPELKSCLVRAGAGAGKTTGLVNQVFEVYKTFRKTGRDPRIVVTTFTRKATQELKERLIKRACDDQDPGFLQFVSDPAKLHISTIHGLLNIFLKICGHLAGLDSGFTLLSEFEARHLARRALREAMVNHPDGFKWFETFDFERVLFMCREYDRKFREFGNLEPATAADLEAEARPRMEKAKAALLEFSASILEENDNEEWVEFAQKLKLFADAWPGIEIESLPKRPDKRSKVQKALSAWHDRSDEIMEPFKKQFGKAAWSPENWKKSEELWREFAEFGKEFSKQFSSMKEGQGRYEMNDLELLTAVILQEKPFLAEVFADNWDYWMVDEYQDTSPIQSRCLSALIAGRPRYLVGDPQQSIYLFRGADVQVFARAEVDMLAEGSETRELMRNYRSEPELLHFINDFMASVDSAFMAMTTAEIKDPGHPVCEIFRASDEDAEMEALAAKVGELVAKGVELQDICILGRAHNHLRDAATRLKKYGFPTHLHASSGFAERREVLDGQALWTFLLNPHDTENLVALLRSPWFFTKDSKLEEWMAGNPRSLWRFLQGRNENEDSVKRLREALDLVTEIGVVKAFEKILAGTGYLDLCLINDPAGRKESNLWKLIDKARELESESTRSLLDLAAGEVVIDPLEASEGDATSAQEPNCINLMTIHAAKGLEFKHVLVPRMGKGLRPTRCPDFGAKNGKYYFPLKDEESGENQPSILDLIAIEEQREAESREFNRALYVAATRAKSSLTYIFSNPEKESWAARSPWFQLSEGAHSFDKFTFHVRTEIPTPTSYAASRESRATRPLWARWESPKDAKQSVTGLIAAKGKSKTGAVMIKFQARNKGQRIHRMLESLKYRGIEGPTGDPAVDYVLELQNPPMEELIRDGFVEWGFQVRTKAGLLEGQIDAWGKWNGEIFVIDYKSGSPDHLEDAFQQLATYSWALRQFGHNEKITMCVIYPLQETLEMREFTGELFATFEAELGLSETAGQDDLAIPLFDRSHGDVEGDLVGGTKPVEVRI